LSGRGWKAVNLSQQLALAVNLSNASAPMTNWPSRKLSPLTELSTRRPSGCQLLLMLLMVQLLMLMVAMLMVIVLSVGRIAMTAT